MEPVARYIARLAEPEAELATAIPGAFEHAIVIPSCGEGAAPAAMAEAIAHHSTARTLLIVVVNARTNHGPDIDASNRETLEAFQAAPFRLSKLTSSATQTRYDAYYGEYRSVACLAIDRAGSDRRFPEREGVGLARKLGADIALALEARGSLTSRWIHFTDADAELPNDFAHRTRAFVGSHVEQNIVAAVYPFRHRFDALSAVHRSAALTYDAYLRYHVAGLRYAQSPFAFHTIGSTMAVRADAYAAAQGCPKLLAGEDFYLLAKLAKLGQVASLAGDPILLSARCSPRVPFGTGAALTRMLAEATDSTASANTQSVIWPAYDPRIYDYLRAWHKALHRFAEVDDASALDSILVQSCTGAGAPAGPAALEISLLRRTLLALDAPRAVASAHARAGHAATRLRHMFTWFDAFRTLKFIHMLRDTALPSLPTAHAISAANFAACGSQSDIATLQSALTHMDECVLPLVHGLS